MKGQVVCECFMQTHTHDPERMQSERVYVCKVVLSYKSSISEETKCVLSTGECAPSLRCREEVKNPKIPEDTEQVKIMRCRFSDKMYLRVRVRVRVCVRACVRVCVCVCVCVLSLIHI